MKVKVRFTEGSQLRRAAAERVSPTQKWDETFRNITEVHYLYPSVIDHKRVAFESDIHRTGFTYSVVNIAEMEVTPETEKADDV